MEFNMKKLLLLPILLLGLNLSASPFCDGWEEGYQQALDECLYSAVTPVCPIEPINSQGFKSGFGHGYAAATRDYCE